MARDGEELLNPRSISLEIIGDDSPNSTDVTLLVMSFGQFVTHDITMSQDFTFGIILLQLIILCLF
jgi:peroxidase